jgi:hypothetical protein
MVQRVRKSWMNPRHTPSSSCRRPSFPALTQVANHPNRREKAEEQQHKQHALAAPPRYPREHGRYGRTEEDEGDGVLDGFGHGPLIHMAACGAASRDYVFEGPEL